MEIFFRYIQFLRGLYYPGCCKVSMCWNRESFGSRTVRAAGNLPASQVATGLNRAEGIGTLEKQP